MSSHRGDRTANRRGRRARGPSRRTRRRVAAFVLLLATVLFAACRDEPLPQDTFDTAGPYAREAADLYLLAFWIAVVIFVLVEGLILFAAFRYRSRRRDELPVQIHGNTRLEVLWTVVPALLLVVIGVPTIRGIFRFAAEPEGDVLQVRVIAHQWWWEIHYPDLGLATANELHVPVDVPVRVALESREIPGGQEQYGITSADAVIHSFWVPRITGKQDVIPGRVNHLTLLAEEPGVYLGQCAEFCGISHANMRFRVVAQPQRDFDAWVEGQRAGPAPADGALEEEGERLFQSFVGVDGTAGSCLACHSIDPSAIAEEGSVGPNLAHLAGRERFGADLFELTPENLASWLRDPRAMKAGVKMPDYNLSEPQIEALVAYLMTLE